MNKQKNEQTNNHAGKTGNKFSVGDTVRFRKGLPREIFGPIVSQVTRAYVDKKTGMPMVELDGGPKFGEDLLILTDDDSDEEDAKLEEKVFAALECCVNFPGAEPECYKCPYNNNNCADCVDASTKDIYLVMKRYRMVREYMVQAMSDEVETTMLACDSIKCEDCFLKDVCLVLEENNGEKELYGCASMHNAIVKGGLNKITNILGRKKGIHFVKDNPELLPLKKDGAE